MSNQATIFRRPSIVGTHLFNTFFTSTTKFQFQCLLTVRNWAKKFAQKRILYAIESINVGHKSEPFQTVWAAKIHSFCIFKSVPFQQKLTFPKINNSSSLFRASFVICSAPPPLISHRHRHSNRFIVCLR